MRKGRFVTICTTLCWAIVIAAVVTFFGAVWMWGRKVERTRWEPTPTYLVTMTKNYDGYAVAMKPVAFRRYTERVVARRSEQARRKERFAEVACGINMGAIVEIESAGNPLAVSSCGCRGLCQISKATWDECTRRMGVDWSWNKDAWQPGENRVVARFYMNVRIPEMLRYYGIRDSVETRIAAYNWGIGKLALCWRRYGANWIVNAPVETLKYIEKYHGIMLRQEIEHGE